MLAKYMWVQFSLSLYPTINMNLVAKKELLFIIFMSFIVISISQYLQYFLNQILVPVEVYINNSPINLIWQILKTFYINEEVLFSTEVNVTTNSTRSNLHK